MMRARTVAAALALATLAACSPGYLLQAAGGQLELARARRPVAEVLADPATAATLRARLEVAADAVRFAHGELALPDNGSYAQYAELHRPYVVWNVFAAPEFSLALRTWCFPVAGCVAYRGYFAHEDAREYAGRLAARGDDVHIGGAVAYSTLGFFRDPLPSTAMRLPDAALAGLVFHELAHQQVYAKGDTVFNESFASLVEQEGTARWLESRGDTAGLCRLQLSIEREAEVQHLLGQARAQLDEIYRSSRSVEKKRAAKVAAIEGLRARYRDLRAGWPDPPWFDAWFAGTLDNASLGAIAAYDQLVGKLRVILEAEGGNLPAFYRRAARLARLDPAGRADVLREIRTSAARRSPPACSS